jgi:uncharacterized membrane protein YGL010W
MNEKLRGFFAEYDTFHRNPINQLTHKIAIPLIFFNAVAMLDWLRLVPVSSLPNGSLTVADVALVVVGVWYLKTDFKLGFITLVFLVACVAIGWVTPVWVVVFAGIAGWIIQLLGHLVWEKNAPNFTRNGIQSLVGPLYFIALYTGDWVAPQAAVGSLAAIQDGGVR